MAATVINPVKLNRNAANAYPTLAALNASAGGVIPWEKIPDGRALIIISGTASDTVTIKGGNGVGAQADIKVSVTADAPALVTLESAGYLNVSGDLRGKIHITGAATSKVAVVIL